MTLFT